uniref:Uncharacterized protein n=1 Tax=Lotus japonicus TaxID=34305 RepID=I3SK17_LOTJA|nr:unknown [Lotus japonicus]
MSKTLQNIGHTSGASFLSTERTAISRSKMWRTFKFIIISSPKYNCIRSITPLMHNALCM